MPAHDTATGPRQPWDLSEAETIAFAYHSAAGGDAWRALVAAVTDALADLDRADAIIRERGRQVSHGYVRGGLDGSAPRDFC